MLTRIVAALVFTPLFLAFLLFTPTLLVSGISAVAAFELLRAVQVKNGLIRAAACIAAALIPACYRLQIDGWAVKLVLMGLLIVLFLAAVLTYGTEKAIRAEQVLFGLFGGILYPVLMSSLIQLSMLRPGGREPYGMYFVLLPVISAFLTDTGAYFFGVFFGRHRGIVPVSPKKSAEGFIGGLLSGVLFMTLYGAALNRFFFWHRMWTCASWPFTALLAAL